MDEKLPARTGFQQRVLPTYRAPLFDALARALPGGLAVFAGDPRAGEGILQAEELRVARWTRAHNRRIGGLLWQDGWREWLAKEDPQTVVLESNPRYLSNYFLQRRMRNGGKKVVGWSLGPARSGGIFGGLIRSYYGAFSALVVYSRSGADRFHRLGLPSEKIFIAPNAVESETAETLLRKPDARRKARAELGFGSLPVVLFVGRLQPRKRVDLLLRACRRSGVAFNLVIVGDGPDRARLERIAGEVFPAARFAGDLRGETLGRIFLAADLFVLPGTGGLALQEALVYGKPVAVAEADGSQQDLVREGENGWMLPPGDEEALIALLRTALTDKARLRAMGEASRRLVRQTATLDRMVDGFLNALRFSLR
jgi:glycosyltransferase involved in cell wall biosynthesis